MCGRFASSSTMETLRDVFGTTGPLPAFEPRYNVAPSQRAPIVRYDPKDDRRSLDLLQWGLVPRWAEGPDVGAGMINARAEGIGGKPSFREAFRRRRCLIPVIAFYEWASESRPKRPFAFRLKDGGPFALAGLWEGWKDPMGEWLKTFTIITCPANETLRPVHTRMPVVVAPADYAIWLGETPCPASDLGKLLSPCPGTVLDAVPVGPFVSNTRNEGPHLLTPLG